MFGWFKAALEEPMNLEKALDCYRRGAFKEALRRADAILELGPEVALSWRFKGECLVSLEHYGEAVKCFEKSEKIGGPGTEDVFLWKALALYNSGSRDTARRVLMKFLDSDSQDAELIQLAENTLRGFGVSV